MLPEGCRAPVNRKYDLDWSRQAIKAVSEVLPEKAAAAAYELITGALLENPHRVGKPLAAPMAPMWSARRGTYRVLYLIDDDRRMVRVMAVHHRADAYRT